MSGVPEPESTNRWTGVPSVDVACVSTTVRSGTSPATAACSQPVSAVGVAASQRSTDGGVA